MIQNTEEQKPRLELKKNNKTTLKLGGKRL